MTATLERPESEKTSAAWKVFETGLCRKDVDVRAFIQRNDAPYEGGDFLAADILERTGAESRNDGLITD